MTTPLQPLTDDEASKLTARLSGLQEERSVSDDTWAAHRDSIYAIESLLAERRELRACLAELITTKELSRAELDASKYESWRTIRNLAWTEAERLVGSAK